MNVPRFRTDVFSDVGQKCNNVVLHLALDVFNARNVEPRPFAYDVHCFPGNNAEFRLRFTGKDLDFQPDPELVLFVPDFSH